MDGKKRSETKRLIGKIVSVLMTAVLTLSVCRINTAAVSAADGEPVRVINLVYDDSGSMIEDDDGTKVDTWCQAKYAMEVFAAMLGANDTMNVYVMSDFQSSAQGKPKLVLSGGSGAEANVKKVHGMLTEAGGTPINAVVRAREDLAGVEADEKWLVILTDGEFQGGDINAEIAKKPDGVNVMYLGMGKQAGSVSADESRGIYSDKAKNSTEILEKLTKIGQQVFNRDRLEVDGTRIGFDVPMSELIVFAQGENVSIGDMKSSDGTVFRPIGKPVDVMFSEKSATNYSGSIIDRDLRGSIATYQGNIAEGDYTLDVTGAKTIEVYYKPDVAIAAFVTDSEGNEVTDLSALAAGDYKIDFMLVKRGTNQRVESDLLGDVSYEAVVTNNGNVQECRSGDKITLGEGPLSIDAVAHYLDYHTVETHLDYKIYKDKTVGFEVADNPTQKVGPNGFEEGAPMKIRVTLDGAEPTDEQWAAFTLPEAEYVKSPAYKMDDIRVVKSSEKGIYELYPSVPENKPNGKTYEDTAIRLTYSSVTGEETWKGSGEVTMKIEDTRSFFVKHRDLILTLIGLLILLIILIGYTPIKKRIPRSVKRQPLVKCRHDDEDPYNTHAKFEKNKATVFLPYVAETGTVKIASRRFSLKGVRGGRRILLTNAKALESKDIKIGDKKLKDFTGKVEFGPGSEIVIKEDDGWKYICQLSVTDKTQKRRGKAGGSGGKGGKSSKGGRGRSRRR